MKKMIAFAMTVFLSFSSFGSSVYALPDLSDLAEAAGNAAGKVAETAGNAAGSVAETAGNVAGGIPEAAGNAASSVAETAGNVAGGISQAAGNAAGSIAEAAGNIAGGISEAAGNAASSVAETAGNIAGGISEAAGNAVSSVAETAGNAASGVSEAAGAARDALTDGVKKVGEMISGIIVGITDAVSGTIEQFGEDISEKKRVFREKSEAVALIVGNVLSRYDLGNEEKWDEVRRILDRMLENAWREGMLGRTADLESIHAVTNILTRSLMYSYQCCSGQISLKEYLYSMSEIFVREGLPAGAGYIVDLFIPVPNADRVARSAAQYLIDAVYGEEEQEELR